MSSYAFPNQRIPESQKDEKWHIAHVLGYVSYAATSEFIQKKKEIRELIYSYHGILTKEQKAKCKAMITDRFGENFGPQFIVYPLIENMVEQVVGRYRLRPLIKKALVNNKRAVAAKLDEKVNLAFEALMRDVNKEVEQKIGFSIETEQPDVEIPEDIDEFFEKDYRTISEEIAEDVLYQVLEVFKDKEKVYDLLRWYCVTGRCYGSVIEKNGHPSIFVPNLLDCFYDIDYTQSLQDNLDYFVWDKFMTVNEIFNTFSLSKTEKKKIESMVVADKDNQSVNHSKVNNQLWFSHGNDGHRLRVVCMNWKSRRTQRFKIFTNKDGVEEAKILPDNYKERPRDEGTIKRIEIEDERHVTMIGPDLCISWGREKDQMKRHSDKKVRYLSTLGVIDEQNIGTGEIRSIAKKLIGLQDFASEILYELRLSLRQMDGSALVYDLANIPKMWANLNPDQVMKKVNFYLKRDRIQIINSKGRKSNPYASSVNVSQKGRINEVIGLLAVIEDLAKKITGITAEELGQAAQYAKATVAEMNMSGGLSRTEEHLGPFVSFQAKLFERVVMKSKLIYKKGDVFSFYGGDNQLKFLQVQEPYFDDDLGIHIGDNRKEMEKVAKIEAMAEQAFASPQQPKLMLELLKMYNSESTTEKEAVFKKGIAALEKMAKENDEANRQIEKDKIEQIAANAEKEDQRHEETLQNNLDVAAIYADNKADIESLKQENENLRTAGKIAADMTKDEQNQNNNS